MKNVVYVIKGCCILLFLLICLVCCAKAPLMPPSLDTPVSTDDAVTDNESHPNVSDGSVAAPESTVDSDADILTSAESESTETLTEGTTDDTDLAETAADTAPAPLPETASETETEGDEQPVQTLPFIPASPTAITSDWKSIWLSQFDLYEVYTDNGRQRSEASFGVEMGKVLDTVKNDGFNTVILQVRPNGDSFYPSDVYPPSRYVVGSYSNDFTYDPFAVVIELCRERGLAVHAWINPMRCMSDTMIQEVSDGYLLKQWYDQPATRGDYIVLCNNYWYLNPAYPQVRKLIVDGVAELLSRYPVDGVHMDDYFYPTTDASFDRKAYDAYTAEGGTKSLTDWRYENLDKLVSELYAAVKSHDLRTLFGISPAGNLNNVLTQHFANVTRWCAEPGFIDYICPQIYWGFEHKICPFGPTADLWSDLIKTEYVSLIVGMTFERPTDDPLTSEFENSKNVMARCVLYTMGLDHCVGVSVYAYQRMFNPNGTYFAASNEEHIHFSAQLKAATWH